ncbi:MAG: alpha/beta fold hydrolase [Patescibacteria group bacterium]|jgi:hypothetical protein
MSPKKFIIVHGWASHPQMYWFPWLKKELEKNGCEVIAPELPNPTKPKIEEWIPYLQKTIGAVDENTFFIGHSVGCQAILRFLQSLPESTVAGGAYLVAPFVKLEGFEAKAAEQWIKTPLDAGKIKKQLRNSVAFFSDNDPLVPLKNREFFSNELGSKIIVLSQRNHFDGVKTFPELNQELKKVYARGWFNKILAQIGF